MSLGERIRERLEGERLSQAELARAVGVSPQAISKLVLGATQETPKLNRIARELKTTPEYLMGETNDPKLGGTIVPVEPINEDEVEIDMIDLAYGMGGTFLDTEAVEIEKIKLSRAWLRQFTDSAPGFLASAQGMGDSMMPTIHDRDVVIIDRSQNNLATNMSDKIWAITFGGLGMIKRLRPMPDGTVKISSDNLQVRDEIASDGELFITGRVIARVSRL